MGKKLTVRAAIGSTVARDAEFDLDPLLRMAYVSYSFLGLVLVV